MQQGYKNVDFKLEELDSSAAWIKTAVISNMQRQSSNALENQFGEQFSKVAIGDKPDGDDDADGAKGYTWHQSEEDIEIGVLLPHHMSLSLALTVTPTLTTKHLTRTVQVPLRDSFLKTSI